MARPGRRWTRTLLRVAALATLAGGVMRAFGDARGLTVLAGGIAALVVLRTARVLTRTRARTVWQLLLLAGAAGSLVCLWYWYQGNAWSRVWLAGTLLLTGLVSVRMEAEHYLGAANVGRLWQLLRALLRKKAGGRF